MALKSETLHKAPNEGINNDAIITSGEDLEDGEIFDDEAEAEEKSETEITKSAKSEIQKPLNASPASNSVAAAPALLSKTVLKNDTHNVPEKNEKKGDKFAAQQQQRWTDENSPKKEEKKSREQSYDGDKRFKEKKLKRKKPKDEDSENDGPAKFKGKKRKTSFERELEKLEDSDYIDEDDEEMLNIRGASPSRWLDMFSDEKDDSFDGSEGGRGGRENSRGRGRGRGGRGFRGGRIDRNARRERIERLSGRGKRRGKGIGMRGGKKGGDEKEICIYHMQGKCHRGDDCPYSHDAMPPRKMELCKFYLMDCCAKKDKCLYMHAEFPCKYFHTGLKCFSGKNCKFRHAKLTDDLRAIHNKTYGLTCISELTKNHQEDTGRPNNRQHLETAPKEILGDFPRLREVTRPLKKNKKIPSLFDVKVSPPSRDMRSQSDSDGNHTPMPSPTHQPNNKDFFRDSMEREHTPPMNNERPRRSEHHHHHHKSGGSGESHRSSRSGGSQPQQSRRASGGGRLEAAAERRERRGDRKAEDGGGGRSSREDQEQHHSHHRHHHHHHHHENSVRRQQSYSPPSRHRYEEEGEEEQHERGEEEEHVNERLKAPEPDQSSNDILSHLPKKQRELFLRIQQQQRQAENSQESNPEDEDQDNDYNKQEENWYSSEDEESTPLTTILKTINIQQKTSMATGGGSTLSSNQQRSQHNHYDRSHNHHDRQNYTQDEQQLHESSSSSSALPVSIPDIDFGDVSALLSKVKQHFQTTTERLKVRDPRLRPEPELSDKQSHQQHSDSHARNSHAPAQLSPSISAILNSAGRGQHHLPSSHQSRSSPSHHNSSSSSFAARSSPPSSHSHHSLYPSRSSPSHHNSSSSFPSRLSPPSSRPSHHHSSSSFPSYSSSSQRGSSFPPATPMLNDDEDDDDNGGIASPPPPEDDSVNLAGLPFKPAPVHTAATEIDASINSHPPIVYRLRPIQPSKPDYSTMPHPAGGALDPRWRKAARFSGGGGAGDEPGAGSRRDPRHRLADLPSHVADPRQRAATASAMLNSSSGANHSLLAPATPRYDDDPSHMSSARGSGMAATPQVVDAMYCPPTPRLDDTEPTPPTTLRPTDPRQRHHNMLSQQNQPAMTSLYEQMRQQQQQMQFMPNQQPMMYDPSRPMYGSDSVNRPYNNYK
ncbi:hypothetical protein LSTR_LSTR013103 [Laodelphax striatellus]|uniref:C3H1-type domain-containing protein n=1 Tax=Laodelphax striatellus TaxID=195883 RepID=A0A482XJB2_LAOST|nr:hypothetical protein LSTR_LSTR013103 [Laodelphax striatellus]